MELLFETPDARAITVRLAGEIDLGNAGALRDVLDLACEPERRIVVDMEGITFIDSSGIHVLVNFVELTGIQHEGLVLEKPSPNVEKIIGILGLAETLGLKGSAPNPGPATA